MSAPHIIQMAHELGVEIVAEGVERKVQVEYLLQRGAQFGQGWHFAKAMRANDLGASLDAHALTAQPFSQPITQPITQPPSQPTSQERGSIEQ